MTMNQPTFAMAADQSGYERYRKPTRLGEFLATMKAIVPWSAWCKAVEPHYPKACNGPPAHWTGAHAAHALHPALV